MEDWYFGYQCLNGSNPLMLRETRHLPPNLSVTSDTLRPFLPEGSSLEKELQVCAVVTFSCALFAAALFNQCVCSL